MYKSLQACRAFAALIVLLYHSGGIIASERYFGVAGFGVPFAFGGAGVEFFFVLSGFIIYHAHRRNVSQPGRLAHYARKRFARIYPTYWIVFFGVLGLALATPALRATVDYDAATLVKALLLLPLDKTVVGGTGAPVVTVAWTLQYEMVFYAFFALMILNRWIAAALVLCFVAGYIALAGDPAPAFPWSFIFRNYTWLFLFGMGTAMACVRWQVPVRSALRWAAFGAGVFALTAAVNIADPDITESRKILLYGIASACMVFGLVQAENAGRSLLAHPFLQLLGDASYALYLVHYPMLSVLCKIFAAIGLPALGALGALIAFVGLVVACVGAAIAFHLLLERPLVRLISRKGKPLPVPAAQPAA